MTSTLIAKHWDAPNNKWIAVLYSQEDSGKVTVLDIETAADEAAIDAWINQRKRK